MSDFSVIITAIDETWSLKKTVATVAADNEDDLREMIIAIAPHTTADCRKIIDEMELQYPDLVRRYEQCRLPGVGGAVIECAEQVRGQWFIMMASDLETPPDKVRDIIARAKKGDVDVVAASRWKKGGGFHNYHWLKLVCNWIFQKLYGLLYATSLTDMTYGYRAYRTALFRQYRWREHGWAFFMESLCTFLRDGAVIAEIPVQWLQRQEGQSHIKFTDFLRYFRIGLTVRFAPKKSFVIGAKEHK